MKKQIQKSKLREAKNASAEAEQMEADLQRMGRSLAESQNTADIAWLRSMAARPELQAIADGFDIVKRIEGSIAWLSEVPSRTLGGVHEGARPGYERLWTMIEMIKKGRYKPKSPEAVQADRSRSALRKMRYRETRDVRPDWMADPSLLPKRPPGR